MRPGGGVDCADPRLEGLMRRFAGIRSSLSHQRAAPPAMPGSDLLEFNSGLRSVLKKQGLITRDPRGKERKKYGKKAARASFQFSKR